MKPFSGDDVIILKQTPLFMRGTNRSGTSCKDEFDGRTSSDRRCFACRGLPGSCDRNPSRPLGSTGPKPLPHTKPADEDGAGGRIHNNATVRGTRPKLMLRLQSGYRLSLESAGAKPRALSSPSLGDPDGGLGDAVLADCACPVADQEAIAVTCFSTLRLESLGKLFLKRHFLKHFEGLS